MRGRYIGAGTAACRSCSSIFTHLDLHAARITALAASAPVPEVPAAALAADLAVALGADALAAASAAAVPAEAAVVVAAAADAVADRNKIPGMQRVPGVLHKGSIIAEVLI